MRWPMAPLAEISRSFHKKWCLFSPLDGKLLSGMLFRLIAAENVQKCAVPMTNRCSAFDVPVPYRCCNCPRIKLNICAKKLVVQEPRGNARKFSRVRWPELQPVSSRLAYSYFTGEVNRCMECTSIISHGCRFVRAGVPWRWELQLATLSNTRGT